jgi:RimJ/RimL family protein N-acetyltransferase
MTPSHPEHDQEARRATIINITGETVALGPASREHLPLFHEWDNDFALTLFAGDPLRPVAREVEETRYDRYNRDESGSSTGFVIFERASMRPIGVTELRHLDLVRRTAEYGISIGEKDCWGKGYGTETTILMLDYGFTVLGLHNIMLDTFSYNERAIRAYTRAGFREIGRRREAQRLGGRVYDVVYMDCLATEFTSPLPRVIALPEQSATR